MSRHKLSHFLIYTDLTLTRFYFVFIIIFDIQKDLIIVAYFRLLDLDLERTKPWLRNLNLENHDSLSFRDA